MKFKQGDRVVGLLYHVGKIGTVISHNDSQVTLKWDCQASWLISEVPDCYLKPCTD